MPGKAQQSGPKTVKNTVLAPHSLDEVPHKKHNPALQFQDHEPVKPPPCTPAFADEGYRFGTNVVSELQLHRQAKQVHLSQKRGEHNAKQCALQVARDAQAEREDQRLLRLQCGAAGKTNRSGDHFDIVQLSYHNSSGGRDLKFRDDYIKYKAGLRTKTIYERQHSVGHDIITCLPLQPAKSYRVPPQPQQH
eukprot:jgi/Astpho2/22/Aster-x0003